MSQFSNSQQDAINVVTHVFSALSMIGSSFVIGTYLFDKKFRTSYNRLVFNMAIADWLMCFSTFLADWPAPYRYFCIWQGIMVQTFVIASVLWNGALSVNVGLLFFFSLTPRDLHVADMYYHLIWVISIVLAFSLLGAHNSNKGPVYGPTNSWCWITKEYDGLRFGAYYSIIFFVFLVSLVTYALVGRVIWKSDKVLRRFENEISSTSTAASRDQMISLPRDLRRLSIHAGSRSSSTLGIKDASIVALSEDGQPAETSLGASPSAASNETTAYTATNNYSAVKKNDQEEEVHLHNGASKEMLQSRGSYTNFGTITASSGSGHRHFHFRKTSQVYVKKVSIYLIVYLINWLPGAANRIYTSVSSNDSLFILVLLNCIFTPSRGLLNSTIYFFSLYYSKKFKGCFSFGPEQLASKATLESHTSASHFSSTSHLQTSASFGATAAGGGALTSAHTPHTVIDPLDLLTKEAENLLLETAPNDSDSGSNKEPAGALTEGETSSDAASRRKSSDSRRTNTFYTSKASGMLRYMTRNRNGSLTKGLGDVNVDTDQGKPGTPETDASAPLGVADDANSKRSAGKSSWVLNVFKRKNSETRSPVSCNNSLGGSNIDASLFALNSDGCFADGVPSLRHLQHQNELLEYMEMVPSTYSTSKYSIDDQKSQTSNSNSLKSLFNPPGYKHKFVSAIKAMSFKRRASFEGFSLNDRSSTHSAQPSGSDFLEGSLQQHFMNAGVNEGKKSTSSMQEREYEAQNRKGDTASLDSFKLHRPNAVKLPALAIPKSGRNGMRRSSGVFEQSKLHSVMAMSADSSIPSSKHPLTDLENGQDGSPQ